MTSKIPLGSRPAPGARAGDRSVWRKVALPSEHGGWGLTLEPSLVALLVAPSWAGVAVGAAALLAFLARTPTKLVLGDLKRDRWLLRTRRAAIVAAVELVLIGALVAMVIAAAGWSWVRFVLAGLPLLAIELWYDARSRGRRLVPELCGAVGIGATAAAIVVLGDDRWQLGVALWAIISGRALVSIPFVRAQISRLRHGTGMTNSTIALQLTGVLVAVVAGLLETSVVVGSIGVVAIAGVQAASTRRPVPHPKVLGLRQTAFGLILAIGTAVGVHIVG